jgi:hypothetical protein
MFPSPLRGGSAFELELDPGVAAGAVEEVGGGGLTARRGEPIMARAAMKTR